MNKLFSNLLNIRSQDFYQLCRKNIVTNRKMFVITANPEIFVKSLSDNEISNLLIFQNHSVVADGIAIVQGAKFLGVPVADRITGIDLTTNLLEYLNEEEGKLYLLGASPEVLNKLVKLIENKYTEINLVGCHDGYSFDEEEIKSEILQREPDLCLVALGVPRQEKLINKIYPLANKGIFIGVGGTFDVLSGTKKRAPKIFIQLRLEWLYRITKEPWRLKRFIHNNIRFMGILLKTKIISGRKRR